ncbi:glycosyltransferase family 2 protein [Blastococcus sp. SYSU D00695]
MPESPDTAGPSVAIVVTHYKSVPALEASLRAVAEHADLAATEVVVADSEEQPGTRELVASIIPSARFVGFADDVGYAVSVRAALEVTTAPYLLVLNADVRVSAGTIETLRDALARDPGLGLVGPVLRYDDGALQDSAFRFYRPQTIAYRRTPLGTRTPFGRRALARFSEPSREVERALAAGSAEVVEADWVLGAALMVRRDAVERVGPPDTRYWMYFEDVDWCLRMWHAGLRVGVVTGTTAHHTYGRASRAKGPLALYKSQMARVHLKSGVKFFRAHGVTPTRRPRGRAAR